MGSDDEFGNEADFYGGYSDDERAEDRRESPHASNDPQNEAGPSKPRSACKPRSKNNSILSYVKVEKSAKQIFGYPSFRGKQKEAVEAAVQGQDVFVLAPTGMGKSLCFQVPAVAAAHGVTLVVSPLLALMKNQVEALDAKGVHVASLTSETLKSVKNAVINDLRSARPKTRLLYVSPERFCTADFQAILEGLHDNGMLNRLVVDEAHCISQWGHDFRAEYRKLGMFRDNFPEVPIMALTATATPAVQSDILRSLNMTDDRLFKALHPFNRANLYYEVRYSCSATGQMKDIYDLISRLHERRGRPSSGIVYCRRRDTCDELAEFLRKRGMNARPYHRGIKGPTLDKTLAEWTAGGQVEGDLHVVVATIAFGLGIDKPDVRYIIHYDLPTSFEGYYQETGRAGRDGAPSRCILYYSREDAYNAKKLVQMSLANRASHVGANGPAPSQRSVDSFDELVTFAHKADTCRHVAICRYFGEHIDARDPAVVKQYCDKMCDVCKNPDKTRLLQQRLSDDSTALTRTSSWADRKPVSRTSSSENTVTRQYGSYNALRKPFRPPLMKVQAEQQVRPSSPVDLEDMDAELEVAFSNKIPVDVREEGYSSIRKALHKAFPDGSESLWTACGVSRIPSAEDLESILLIATKELEFLAQSLSTTPSGYEDRIAGKVDALRLMRKKGKWLEEDDEYDDACEVAGVLKRLCARKGRR
uniref:ATP-dependent DNA helicase n=1 Tax=Schizophyllum commune (strain H4-8 / FGSC 9210) TaxID=578458 RepID=D8PXX1_SCHCM